MVAPTRASAAFRATLPSSATTYELDALSYIYSSRTFTMRLFFFPEIARSTGSGKLFNRPLETVHA